MFNIGCWIFDGPCFDHGLTTPHRQLLSQGSYWTHTHGTSVTQMQFRAQGGVDNSQMAHPHHGDNSFPRGHIQLSPNTQPHRRYFRYHGEVLAKSHIPQKQNCDNSKDRGLFKNTATIQKYFTQTLVHRSCGHPESDPPYGAFHD